MTEEPREHIPTFLDRMDKFLADEIDPDDPGFCCLKSEDAKRLLDIAQRFFRLDKEAATHVETVICMRTHFTGEPPYVGWKGLGLALSEALDERDRLKAALKEARDDIESWGAYADPYFQEKWNLKGALDKYAAILSGNAPLGGAT
jgi:3-deoxy-D-arabino-heptulosonate 7-phosphate (DAHP) synthase